MIFTRQGAIGIRLSKIVGSGLFLALLFSVVSVPSAQAISIGHTRIALTAPVFGATPSTNVTDPVGTPQFTGTMTWEGGTPVTFAPSTVYTAKITLTPVSNYQWPTPAPTFTLTGTSSVTIDAAPSTSTSPINVTAVFKSTTQTVDLLTLQAFVPAPVTGATPVTSFSRNQYSGSIVWSGNPTTFVANDVYTATITLTAASTRTFYGLAENAFTLTGATSVTNPAGSGAGTTLVVTAIFPAAKSTTPALTASAATSYAAFNGSIYEATPSFSTSGGSVDGAVTYTVANGTALGCALSNNTASAGLNALTAGTCVITATKAADSLYFATTAYVTFTFYTAPQSPLIISATTSSAVYNGSAYTATPSFSTTGGAGNGAVTYTVANGTASGCVLTNNTASATLTANSGGTCVITATKAADASYDQTTGTFNFTFIRANQSALTAYQSISSAAYNGSAYTATPSFSTTGGSGISAVRFSVANGTATGCLLSDNTASANLTATGAGTCLITATKIQDAFFYATTATLSFTFNAVYTITFNANGATTGSVPADLSYTVGTTFTKPGNSGSLAKPGWSFTGWIDSNGTFVNSSYIPTSSTTFSARWEANQYLILYDAYDGRGWARSSWHSSGNAPVTLLVPTRTGMTFNGWFNLGSGPRLGDASNLYLTYTPNMACNNYPICNTIWAGARWTANTYTISFDSNTATSGSAPGNLSWTGGQAATALPNSAGSLTKPFYNFGGWSATAGGSTRVNYYSAAADKTFYAIWTPISYIVTYGSNGGPALSPNSATSTAGSLITLATPPTRTGYTFTGWYSAATGGVKVGDAGATYQPTSAKYLYAQWRRN